MKRIVVFIIAMLALVPGVMAQAQGNALKVVTRSGDPVLLLFSQKPQVQFSGTSLTVSAENPDFTQTYAIDDVDRFEFVGATVGIDAPEATQPEITLSRSGSVLTVDNLPEQSSLTLYAIDGRTLLSTRASGQYSISLSDFTPGVYVLRVNKNVIKIKF